MKLSGGGTFVHLSITTPTFGSPKAASLVISGTKKRSSSGAPRAAIIRNVFVSASERFDTWSQYAPASGCSNWALYTAHADQGPTDSAGCACEQDSHRISFSAEKKIVMYPF